jgi:hypothetical protein
MKARFSSWIPLSILTLLTCLMACSAVVAFPRVFGTPIAVRSTEVPPAPELPSPPPGGKILPVPTGTVCPRGDCANACLSKLSTFAQSSSSTESRPKAAGQGGLTSAVTLVTYPVKGDELGAPQYSDEAPASLSALQHDEQAQRRIWDYFTAIIPAAQRDAISYYILATDGRGGMLASAEHFSGTSSTWALLVDPADAARPRDLTFTLLHEFGHLLTLNSSQVKADQAVLMHPDDLNVFEQEAAGCPTYFASGGCSLPDSYINQFYDQFWTRILDEWKTVNAARKKSNYLALLSHFYAKHVTQFVSPYAATSPEEDMAETWSAFVLNRKPADDSIAHRKVLFFYGFPELVELRTQIIDNLCTYAAGQ